MMSKPQPITQALLSRAHSPNSAARIFAEKIERRPVFLGTKSPPPSSSSAPANNSSNARSARRAAREKEKAGRKQRPKPLSARERRRRGFYDVPREGQRYEIFEPLHRLWLGYMHEILGRDVYHGGQGAAAKLTSADFHGAEVEVSRSACPSRVGLRGIVIKDTKFVFEIVTRRNEVKVVPKEGTMFRVEIPPLPLAAVEQQPKADGGEDSVEKARPFAFEILGDQFLHRSADRANKKFKMHFLGKL
jgi:ribonuclease P protein subunit POP4